MVVATSHTQAREIGADGRLVPVGVVSFINTLPLIDGLENLAGIELRHSVPSLLIDELLSRRVDVALCSSIDYLKSPEPLIALPVGMLGCDGPTMTVRLYSTRPLPELTQVHCDTDSHTSVVLMRILLREVHGIDPEIIQYGAREHVADNHVVEWPETMLLIGDKVTTDSPPAVRYPHQLDLGAAWHDLTGLPFVFALWMTRQDADEHRVRTVAMALDRQRRHNRERIDRIIHHRVARRNWPLDLAREYLTQRLKYDLDTRAIEGLERFFSLADVHKLIDTPRPLQWMTL